MANRFAARSGVARGRVLPRRSTQWLGSSDETAVTTLAANGKTLDQTFAFGEPATIVRTRGTLWVASDQTVASESVAGALGMIVVTDQAAAIGASAIPGPSSASDDDGWFVWQPWFADVNFEDATGLGFLTFARYDFDSKAMRKVHDGNTVAVMIENDFAVGAIFLMNFRMLVKLHG